MSTYIDTRDLEDRRQELEVDFEQLHRAIMDAEGALEEFGDGERRVEYEEALEQAKDNLTEWEVNGYRDEFGSLNNLRDKFDLRSWRYGVTLIPESEFRNYAMDLAENIHGGVEGWPFDCIDWEQAADSLRMDYSRVEYNGETYLYRES